jgi:predicted nuclease of predicted toxin-antitoxin system
VKILLDHCVPATFAKKLENHYVRTARQMGWDNLENGKLLQQAKIDFDVFITVDSNIRYQQSTDLPIAIIALRVFDNRLKALIELLPEIEAALFKLIPNKLYEIGPRSQI